MKKTTSERLNEIMHEQNLKQVDILEKAKKYCEKYNIKLTKSDLSQFVSGKVEPGQAKLFILGLTLNVSEAWLMGYDVSPERTNPSEENTAIDFSQIGNILPIKKIRIPMLGEIACGAPIFADQQHEQYVDVNEDYNADFCLKAKGDSMINANISSGDVVLISEMPMVNNGEIAAVIINDEATLKRVYYYHEKNKLVLQAENPAVEPLVYVDEELDTIRILGKAVAVIKTL